MLTQIAKFMGPTWGPPRSCRPQMGSTLAQWTLLSGLFCAHSCQTEQSVPRILLALQRWYHRKQVTRFRGRNNKSHSLKPQVENAHFPSLQHSHIHTITNTIWNSSLFLSLAQSKLRICSANRRAGYLGNMTCDWLSIVWHYSEEETENGPRSGPATLAFVPLYNGRGRCKSVWSIT